MTNTTASNNARQLPAGILSVVIGLAAFAGTYLYINQTLGQTLHDMTLIAHPLTTIALYSLPYLVAYLLIVRSFRSSVLAKQVTNAIFLIASIASYVLFPQIADFISTATLTDSDMGILLVQMACFMVLAMIIRRAADDYVTADTKSRIKSSRYFEIIGALMALEVLGMAYNVPMYVPETFVVLLVSVSIYYMYRYNETTKFTASKFSEILSGQGKTKDYTKPFYRNIILGMVSSLMLVSFVVPVSLILPAFSAIVSMSSAANAYAVLATFKPANFFKSANDTTETPVAQPDRLKRALHFLLKILYIVTLGYLTLTMYNEIYQHAQYLTFGHTAIHISPITASILAGAYVMAMYIPGWGFNFGMKQIDKAIDDCHPPRVLWALSILAEIGGIYYCHTKFDLTVTLGALALSVLISAVSAYCFSLFNGARVQPQEQQVQQHNLISNLSWLGWTAYMIDEVVVSTLALITHVGTDLTKSVDGAKHGTLLERIMAGGSYGATEFLGDSESMSKDSDHDNHTNDERAEISDAFGTLQSVSDAIPGACTTLIVFGLMDNAQLSYIIIFAAIGASLITERANGATQVLMAVKSIQEGPQEDSPHAHSETPVFVNLFEYLGLMSDDDKNTISQLSHGHDHQS